MTLQLSTATLDAIVDAAMTATNDGATPGAWAPVYQLIYSALTTTQYQLRPNGQLVKVTTPLPGVDPTVLTWIEGASAVNANSGGFAS
jgi:hypothetical protein